MDLGNSFSPALLACISIVVVLYYYMFSRLSIGVPKITKASSSFAGQTLEIIVWGIFIFILIINAIQYYYNINIRTDLKSIFTPKPKIDIEVEQPVDPAPPPPPNIQTMPQVFHLKDNKYTYENAKAVCKAYGARLANLEDLQKAHKDGAEWCSYGWSDKQHAFFPTQKKSWDKLQTIKGHENDCGRPGINGGYIGNPNVAFGVNCYGYKPKMNQPSKYSMENQPIYPKTQKELDFDNRVKKWRQKTKDLTVAPFNSKQWSVV
tara:strand:+ start:12061 stop:12849 length:789 start_codon:yes stop_codon:yes gene_type:complete